LLKLWFGSNPYQPLANNLTQGETKMNPIEQKRKAKLLRELASELEFSEERDNHGQMVIYLGVNYRGDLIFSADGDSDDDEL
jgi:hypothetical protein